MSGANGRLGVSGHYAGPMSRLLAFMLDSVIITFSFTVMIAVVAYAIGLVSNAQIDPDQARGLWWGLGFAGWTFLYGLVGLVIAGRTPGMTVVGLRVVNRDGSPLKARRALVRVVTQPVTFLTFGIGFVGLLIGRERRAMHDVLAGTVVVYDWGDRPAELSAPLSRYLERASENPTGP